MISVLQCGQNTWCSHRPRVLVTYSAYICYMLTIFKVCVSKIMCAEKAESPRTGTYMGKGYGKHTVRKMQEQNASMAAIEQMSWGSGFISKCFFFFKHQALLVIVKKLNTDGNNQGAFHIGSVAWGSIERYEGLREAEKAAWCEPRQCFSKALYCWWCAQRTETLLKNIEPHSEKVFFNCLSVLLFWETKGPPFHANASLTPFHTC